MHHTQPNFTEVYTRLEECKALCERQKENFVDLVRQDIATMKEEAESLLKKSLVREVGKVSNEVETMQDTFKRLISQMREGADSGERRIDEALKAVNSRIDHV